MELQTEETGKRLVGVFNDYFRWDVIDSGKQFPPTPRESGSMPLVRDLRHGGSIATRNAGKVNWWY
jgi:hypothetical protein